MDALRKQANKLREQVAKQQQAVLKQFSGSGYGGSDTVVTDEAELQRHQLLEKLYISTRTGKHFQRDIVRGVEGLISAGSRQIEIGTKLSEDCRKYGVESPSYSGGTLAKAASVYGTARAHMEKERDNLNRALGSQGFASRTVPRDQLDLIFTQLLRNCDSLSILLFIFNEMDIT
eukprot:Gb_05416 [translate_table: standard]